MADAQEPGLLDRMENGAAAYSDEYRATLPPSMRLQYDIEVGVAKGAYGFTKSLVTGLIDLTTFATKLASADPESWKKVGETAWGVTKFVGKSFYYTYIASPEERAQFNKEITDKASGLYEQIKNTVLKEWQDAKAQGKEAELISKWTTRGMLEIAPFLIGAGEVNAVTKVSKLSETTKVLEAAEVACPAALEAEKAAALAKQAEKAAEAASEAEKAAAAGTARVRGGPGPVRQGQKGVELAKQAARQRGEEIVGEEITVKTPLGKRRVDLVTRKEGKLKGIEVKTGESPYTDMQKAKDKLIEREGGEATGRKAEDANLKGKVQFPTTEERYKVDKSE